jgi:hypothetical protein
MDLLGSTVDYLHAALEQVHLTFFISQVYFLSSSEILYMFGVYC